MAKKRDFGNVAEGFFSPQQDAPKPIIVEKKEIAAKLPTISNEQAAPGDGGDPKKQLSKEAKKTPTLKKMGRPRADDLKHDEGVFKTSIYLTEETAYMIDIYALQKKMDRSEALRQLIREKCKN